MQKEEATFSKAGSSRLAAIVRYPWHLWAFVVEEFYSTRN
jgi:hypothetical protein